MREKLSPRRLALTERLIFRAGMPGEVKFDVTFGYEPGGPCREVFCLAFKIGADRQDEMHQACIAISVALQSGQSISDLARIMGEDDPALPPHSMIGLIVRAGVMLDDWLTAQYALPGLPLRTWTEQLAAIGATELNEGLSGDDLAEEDGGTLAAIEEAFREHEEHKAHSAVRQKSNATPAGAVMAARSGATGGERAALNSNRSTGAAGRDATDLAEGNVTALRRNSPVTRTDQSEKVEAGGKDCNAPDLSATDVKYLAGQGGSHPAPSYRCSDSALPEMEIPAFLLRPRPDEARV